MGDLGGGSNPIQKNPMDEFLDLIGDDKNAIFCSYSILVFVAF